jgi:cytochrome c oxidase subunit I
VWAGWRPTRRDDSAQLPNRARGHQHRLGNEGMPRRGHGYLPTDGFTALNALSSITAFVLGTSMLPFLWTSSAATGGWVVTVDDPWGFGSIR